MITREMVQIMTLALLVISAVQNTHAVMSMRKRISRLENTCSQCGILIDKDAIKREVKAGRLTWFGEWLCRDCTEAVKASGGVEL